MGGKKIREHTINELSKNKESFVIENFILEDFDNKNSLFKYKQPCIINGMVFVLCIKGQGLIRINLREIEFVKNSILTILPNEIIEILSGSNDIILEVLSFSFDYISDLPHSKQYNLPEQINKNPMLKLEDIEMEELFEFHTLITKQYNKDTPQALQKNIIKGLLYSFLSRIASLYLSRDFLEEKKVSSHQEELTERFLQLLKHHHMQERSVTFYADKMFLTRKHLSTTIKKVTGRSISSWINHVIIAKAKILLKTTDATVTRISEDMNFPNPSFFGRLFKKHTGFTPIQYRES